MANDSSQNLVTAYSSPICAPMSEGNLMTVLHVRYREMVAAAEHLIEQAEQVKSRYGATKADVEKLLHGSWKGIAPRFIRSCGLIGMRVLS